MPIANRAGGSTREEAGRARVVVVRGPVARAGRSAAPAGATPRPTPPFPHQGGQRRRPGDRPERLRCLAQGGCLLVGERVALVVTPRAAGRHTSGLGWRAMAPVAGGRIGCGRSIRGARMRLREVALRGSRSWRLGLGCTRVGR